MDDRETEEGAHMTDRRLVRSTDQRMIAGVAAGVGEYLGVDPTIVRLAFVALSFFGGTGIALYLVMWVIVPKPEHISEAPRDVARANVDDLVDEARRAVGSVRDAAKGSRGGAGGGDAGPGPSRGPRTNGEAGPDGGADRT